MMRRILGWVLVAFVIFFVIKNPAGAAATAQHLGNGAAQIATSLGEFFTHLTGGAR